MKKFLAFAIALSFALGASAQKTLSYEGADETIRLWDNTTAKHSNHETRDEKWRRNNTSICQTSSCELYIFKAAEGKNTGVAIAMFPGGSYTNENLQISEAKWYASQGITAALVKYRLPNYGHKEVPLEDAQAALAYLRKNAKKLGFDPAKVGIAGSSAGGHLAAYTSTFTPDAEKPAFAVLFYPVISAVDCMTHQGTFDQLLGKQQPAYLRDYYSLENRVTPTTPPTILILSTNDRTVPPVSSIRYYKALRYYGVDAAMHIYPEGGHGWVGREGFRYEKDWQHQLNRWMQFLNKDKNDKK